VIHRDADGNPSQYRGHAIEVVPDLPLDPRGGRGAGPAKPPELDCHAAERGKNREQHTAGEKPAGADAPVA